MCSGRRSYTTADTRAFHHTKLESLHSEDGMIGTGVALFEADFGEGVFHWLARDPDDSLERAIELLHHFDCPRDRERAEEQRQDCCRVMRRKQAEAQKEKAQPEDQQYQQRNCEPSPVLLGQ